MKTKYFFDKAFERPNFFLRQAFNLYQSKLIPEFFTERQISKFERNLTPRQKKRLNYYLKNDSSTYSAKPELSTKIKDFRNTKNSFQYYDVAPLLHRFNGNLRFNIQFGDITEVPSSPTFVKSRPIHINNQNAVLLKMGSMRHFYFLDDDISWQRKSDTAIWRGHAHNRSRQKLIRDHVKNKLVDAAQTNQNYPNLPPKQDFMGIPEQLNHKFIISIEGHDVATNLKWAMNSNSIVISPKLNYETWFMEGTLVPGEHFIEVKRDFSDLEEKIEYYLCNPKEAAEINRNAKAYTKEFRHNKNEWLMNLLVVKNYLNRFSS